MADQKQRPTFISKEDVRALIRAELKHFRDQILSPALGSAISKIMREHSAELEAKIAAGRLEFKGVWEPDVSYRSGHVVNHGGTAFVCLIDNPTAKPGLDVAQWGVLSARGRDGRDGVDGKDAQANEGGEPQQRSARTARAHPRP